MRDGNRQEGSLELSEAANVFSQHATESSNALKEDLEFSASEFSGMAERVFDSPSITMTEMDAVLTRGFWALAAYNYRKAAERWADGQKRQTAQRRDGAQPADAAQTQNIKRAGKNNHPGDEQPAAGSGEGARPFDAGPGNGQQSQRVIHLVTNADFENVKHFFRKAGF